MMGKTPMPGTIQLFGYREGRGVLVFLTVVLCVMVAGLLFIPQRTPIAGGLWTNSVQGKLQQKYPNEEFLPTDPPGTTFIYSFQPWGGIQGDDTERHLLAMWDVYVLPWRLGGDLLSTDAHIGMVAESEMGMKRGAIRPSVQFLRVRNMNWMTTS